MGFGCHVTVLYYSSACYVGIPNVSVVCNEMEGFGHLGIGYFGFTIYRRSIKHD